MGSNVVYQTISRWSELIHEAMPLGKWQALNLALLSFGILLARSCTLSIVSEGLWVFRKADSIERRFQRFLSNSRLSVELCARSWSKWVIRALVSNQATELVLLVDETKLSNHLSIMVVALAYRKRAVPLAWRCYHQNEWPCGQVELISTLLSTIAKSIPSGVIPLVQVDRGLGTSPELVRCVEQMGWHYLFRVQGQTRFYALGQQPKDAQALNTLTKRGKGWKGHGYVFKHSGWVECWAQVIWKGEFEDGWCLITNRAGIEGRGMDGKMYGVRVWQEEAFRDMKSGGWQWQRSHVWKPAHAERLLLGIALAYAIALSLGTEVIKGGKGLKRELTRGRTPRYGVMRLGLRYLSRLLTIGKPLTGKPLTGKPLTGKPVELDLFLVQEIPLK